jgi:hypothetical protein
MWDRFAEKSPIPYIPDVTAGWDGRPNREAPLGHLWWYERTPGEVGAFVHAAVEWGASHPSLQPEAPPAKPLVLIEAWNELQEGSFILPTIGAGYGYSLAVASALGIHWSSAHRRTLTLALQGRRGSGSISVPDGWSDCRLASVVIGRHVGSTWKRIARARSRLDGTFSFPLAKTRGVYRASIAHTTAHGQGCGAARSAAVSP